MKKGKLFELGIAEYDIGITTPGPASRAHLGKAWNYLRGYLENANPREANFKKANEIIGKIEKRIGKVQF
jgi:hypothetical protein